MKMGVFILLFLAALAKTLLLDSSLALTPDGMLFVLLLSKIYRKNVIFMPNLFSKTCNLVLSVMNLSLSLELGLALLEVKSSLNDSKNFLSNWKDVDESPCHWTGILCSPQDQRVVSMYV